VSGFARKYLWFYGNFVIVNIAGKPTKGGIFMALYPAETSCEAPIKQATVSERLERERERLELRLEEVNAAIEALNASPEVKIAVDAVSKLVHF
jgi:hypothetical protein